MKTDDMDNLILHKLLRMVTVKWYFKKCVSSTHKHIETYTHAQHTIPEEE